VPVATVEADINARIQAGVTDGPEILNVRDRLIPVAAKVIAAGDQLLAG